MRDKISMSYYLKKYKLINILILIIAFLSPFEESCIQSISYIIRLFLFIIGLFTIFFVILEHKIIISKNRLLLFSLFIIPILLSFWGMTYVQIVNPNGLYFKNVFFDTIGRILNYTFLVLFAYRVLGFQKYRFCNGFDNDSFIKSYWLGCLLAIIFCIWQFISMYFGVIPFPFNTRDYVNSVSGSIASIVPGRITGILEEPSYIVPVILDFVFLSYFYVNNYFKMPMIVISLLCLFFTFSGSAGLEFLLLILSFYLYLTLFICCNKNDKTKTIIWGALTLVIVASFVLLYRLKDGLLMLFLSRLSNVAYSGRFKTFILPFVLSFDSSYFNLIFGHGVKSFILLEGRDAVTSNSLYPDIFWEHGLIGLLGIFIFAFLVLKKYIFKKLTNRRILIILFIFHFLIASLYRSDFASTRSFIIIMIITILCEKEKIRPFSINHNLKEVN